MRRNLSILLLITVCFTLLCSCKQEHVSQAKSKNNQINPVSANNDTSGKKVAMQSSSIQSTDNASPDAPFMPDQRSENTEGSSLIFEDQYNNQSDENNTSDRLNDIQAYSQEGSSNYVRCIELTPKNPPQIVQASLKMYDENAILDKATLIVKGRINDKKEIAIEDYINGNLTHTYYKSILTINVEKIFFQKNNNLKEGDSVIVSSEVSSYFYIDGAIELEKGKEYILFLDDVEDSPSVKFSEYSDFFVIHPFQAIVAIEDNTYQFDMIFESLAQNADQKVRVFKQGQSGIYEGRYKIYVKDKSFEDDLKTLIDSKIKQ